MALAAWSSYIASQQGEKPVDRIFLREHPEYLSSGKIEKTPLTCAPRSFPRFFPILNRILSKSKTPNSRMAKESIRSLAEFLIQVQGKRCRETSKRAQVAEKRNSQAEQNRARPPTSA